jgi:hypothetical protein
VRTDNLRVGGEARLLRKPNALEVAVTKTVLVETLLECSELQTLYDALPPMEDTATVEKRIADCEAILDYLRARFAEANREHPETARVIPWKGRQKSEGSIDMQLNRSELAAMDDKALLRYGTVLKYICAAEASLQEMPLDECVARLDEARIEWCRRFGRSVIAGSV